MIDVTGVDLRLLIKEAYNLSYPQGMGFLHYREGELDDETVNRILEQEKNSETVAISMDYVHGRAVKLWVFKTPNGTLYINDAWFDHSDIELDELCRRIGIRP